jgi:type I restriction enzyme S subunit
MSDWHEAYLGDEIELAYGKSLPAHARQSGRFGVFGSNGLVGTHDEACVDGPGIIVGRKGSVGEVTYSVDAFWPIDTTYYVVVSQFEISAV